MLVVVSGLDKVGKTTLAKEISDTFSIPYIKFTGPATIKVDDPLIWARDTIIFHESILRFLEKLYAQHFIVDGIFDRFYPDEIVYSKVFRNVNLFEAYRKLDIRFAQIKMGMIYVCPPDFSILNKRWSKEKKVSIKRIDELLEGFDEFINHTKLPVCRLPGNFSLSQVKEPIKEFLRMIKNEDN